MDILEGILWLTLNVYHEGRSENAQGQQAIVNVTMNRAKNKNKTIKQVVLTPKQFSWTHRLKDWTPHNTKVLLVCLENVFKGLDAGDFTKGSTFYHHKSITPYWASTFTYVNTYGTHKFYYK